MKKLGLALLCGGAKVVYKNRLGKAEENIPKIRSMLEDTKIAYTSQLESPVDTVYMMAESDNEAL